METILKCSDFQKPFSWAFNLHLPTTEGVFQVKIFFLVQKCSYKTSIWKLMSTAVFELQLKRSSKEDVLNGIRAVYFRKNCYSWCDFLIWVNYRLSFSELFLYLRVRPLWSAGKRHMVHRLLPYVCSQSVEIVIFHSALNYTFIHWEFGLSLVQDNMRCNG